MKVSDIETAALKHMEKAPTKPPIIMKWYAMAKGHMKDSVGVNTSWAVAARKVDGISGVCHKSIHSESLSA